MWYHVDSEWPSDLLLVYVSLEVWYKSNVQILNGHARWQRFPPAACRAFCRPPVQRLKKSYAQVGKGARNAKRYHRDVQHHNVCLILCYQIWASSFILYMWLYYTFTKVSPKRNYCIALSGRQTMPFIILSMCLRFQLWKEWHNLQKQPRTCYKIVFKYLS